MSEQAQVGDTVRLTYTWIYEGKVTGIPSRLRVGGWLLDGPDRTVEILSRATPPLPSEPGTWWLDAHGYMWTVNAYGSLFRPGSMSPDPQNYSPFRQLVLK